MIKKITINADRGGLCKTIKSQYFKMGAKNVLTSAEEIGSNFAATGVLIEYE